MKERLTASFSAAGAGTTIGCWLCAAILLFMYFRSFAGLWYAVALSPMRPAKIMRERGVTNGCTTRAVSTLHSEL